MTLNETTEDWLGQFDADAASRSVVDRIVLALGQSAIALWDRRAHGLTAPSYDLAQLARLEDQLRLRVGGLCQAGQRGLEVVRQLESWLPGPGGRAIRTLIALGLGRDDELRSIIAHSSEQPAEASAIADAARFAPSTQRRRVAAWLQAETSPALQAAGVRLAGTVGIIPRRSAVEHGAAAIRSQALVVLGRLGPSAYGPHVERTLDQSLAEPIDSPAFVPAAICGARIGWPPALPALRRALSIGHDTRRAANWLVRHVDVESGRALLADLGYTAAGIQVAAALGTVDAIDWLLRGSPRSRQQALVGEAFTLATGIEFEAELETEDLELHGLPRPSSAVLAARWRQLRGRLDRETRHLLGRPLDPHHCRAVLEAGRQWQRHAAVVELGCREPDLVLPDLDAPADQQLEPLPSGAPP